MKTKAAVVFILFFLLLSCAQIDKYLLKPTVKVESVSIKDFSFSDITLDFELFIHNPNAFGISLNGFNYQFIVEEKSLLRGTTEKALQIEGNGNSKIQIPVTVVYKDLYDLYKGFKDRDSLAYRFAGSIQPGGLLQALDIPFSTSGMLPNVRIPSIEPAALSVVSVGLSGIDLALAMNVKNPNVFGFEIANFAYQIDLNGKSFARGFSENLAALSARGSDRIELPISMSFSDVAASIRSLLSSGKTAAIGLEGNTDLKTPMGFVNFPFAVEKKVEIQR